MATIGGKTKTAFTRYSSTGTLSKALLYKAPSSGRTLVRFENVLAGNASAISATLHYRQFNPVTNVIDSGLDVTLVTGPSLVGNTYTQKKQVFNSGLMDENLTNNVPAVTAITHNFNPKERVVDLNGIKYFTMFPGEEIRLTTDGNIDYKISIATVTES